MSEFVNYFGQLSILSLDFPGIFPSPTSHTIKFTVPLRLISNVYSLTLCYIISLCYFNFVFHFRFNNYVLFFKLGDNQLTSICNNIATK